MKKLMIWAMVLTSIMMASCAKSKEGDEDVLGSIYGIVTELGTAEPMRAMGVELYKSDKLLLKTVTFDDGHFEFVKLSQGDYQVKVVSDEYEQIEKGLVTVEAGRQARIDLQVRKLNTGMVVRTIDASINGTRVSLKGEYTYNSYDKFASEIGFVYATHSSPQRGGTVVKCKTDDIKKTGYTGSFFAVINGLTGGTYYFQAYAINEKGKTYGELRSFKVDNSPVVTTLASTNVSQHAVTLNGRIEAEGNPTYIERGFVFSTSLNKPSVEDPADITTKTIVAGHSNYYTTNISSLYENATYYVRAYATNENGTAYGDVLMFRTGHPDYVIIDNIMIQRRDLGSADLMSSEDMCESSRIGGVFGWRLPTLAELFILYNHKNEIGGFEADYYWSSTHHYGLNYHCIDFSDGMQYSEYNTNQFYVRAVCTK